VRQALAVFAGKVALFLTRLRGGGSAFPGFVALKVAPNLLSRAFAGVPEGVVFVLGSNGKSTTTHMISELFRGHGLKVFTNPTGANLPQGVASALLPQVGLSGLVKADVAVLEVDEAFAEDLAKMLKPRFVLGLNTQVDQLYRFFETERVGKMMLDAMALARSVAVGNADDPFLCTIDHVVAEAAVDKPEVRYFGVAENVIAESPNGLLNAKNFTAAASEVVSKKRSRHVEVVAYSAEKTTLSTQGSLLDITLPAAGLHYAMDAAAAVAIAQSLLGQRWSAEKTVTAFGAMKPAYGRGEVLPFGETDVQFVMFKNLASLQLNLDSLTAESGPILLAIDEGTPDMSWIYDIRFENLPRVEIITGDKAWQMATCLAMKGVSIGKVEPDIAAAVDHMRSLIQPGLKQTWIVNYEVTMIARRLIGFGELETRSS
jgi:UDP-N-acetylmuramyl tripeptide synthase